MEDVVNESVSAKTQAHARLKQKAVRAATARKKMDASREKMRATIEKHLVEQNASIGRLAIAAGMARNYVDRIKAKSQAAPLRGKRADGQPSIRKVSYDPDRLSSAIWEVQSAAKRYNAAKEAYAEALADRDALMCDVYRLRLMGPTEIGRSVDLDRNSVMRITRAAGVPRMRDDVTEEAAS